MKISGKAKILRLFSFISPPLRSCVRLCLAGIVPGPLRSLPSIVSYRLIIVSVNQLRSRHQDRESRCECG